MSSYLCPGDCCFCACGDGGCIAGHGDDYFSYAEDNVIFMRIKLNRYPSYREKMLKHLGISEEAAKITMSLKQAKSYDAITVQSNTKNIEDCMFSLGISKKEANFYAHIIANNPDVKVHITGIQRATGKTTLCDKLRFLGVRAFETWELENKNLIAFVRLCQSKYNCYDGYFDSAETTLIKGVKTACAREKLAFNVHNARKSEILGRIRFTNLIMSQNRFFVMRHCRHVIEAFQSAVWDSKSQTDSRLDDGNYNIDSLDAFEYSAEPQMNDIIEVSIKK